MYGTCLLDEFRYCSNKNVLFQRIFALTTLSITFLNISWVMQGHNSCHNRAAGPQSCIALWKKCNHVKDVCNWSFVSEVKFNNYFTLLFGVSHEIFRYILTNIFLNKTVKRELVKNVYDTGFKHERPLMPLFGILSRDTHF